MIPKIPIMAVYLTSSMLPPRQSHKYFHPTNWFTNLHFTYA